MKKSSNTIFLQMSTSQLENLTAIVHETLAEDFTPSKRKTFTAADLWNIQRQGKNRTQRRLSF